MTPHRICAPARRPPSRTPRYGGLLAAACACAITLLPALAEAAPIELVEQRDSYMIFRDPDGSLATAAWLDEQPFFEAYADVEAGFLAVHPDDSQMIIMLTTWEFPPEVPFAAFFQSLANDIEGIGFQHAALIDPFIPDEGMGIFDSTPNSNVSAFLHMNTWTQYTGPDPGGVSDFVISLLFGQEIGHAWLAFVHADQGAGPEPMMLGRSNAHWSFYLDTGGSPVEGNQWVENGDGTFTAFRPDVFEYSDLDLYLMGLMPPEDVQPWYVLENVTNCIDSQAPFGACAPPDYFGFEAESYTVTATRRDISIEDVIAAEGPRVPAWPNTPNEFDVSFVVVTRPDEVLDEESKQQIDAIVNRAIELFDQQTRGQAHLVNRTVPPEGGDTTGGMDETGGSTGADESTGDGGSTGPSTTNGTTNGTTSGTPGDSSGGASESPGTATDPEPTSGESSGEGAGGNGEGEGGCGCHSDGSRGEGALGALGLVVLAAVRGRRRDRRSAQSVPRAAGT